MIHPFDPLSAGLCERPDTETADLAQPASVDELWRSLLAHLRRQIDFSSCSLYLDLAVNEHPAPLRRQAGTRAQRPAETELELECSRHFLGERTRTAVYTSAAVSEEFPGSARRLQAAVDRGEVPWQSFLHLVFWEDGLPDILISLHRDAAEGGFSAEEVEAMQKLHPILEGLLQRARERVHERSRNFALLQFFGSMPLPVVLLDWNLRLIFASQEGYETCVMWNFGTQGSRMLNSRSSFRLPTPIEKGCRQLRQPPADIAEKTEPGKPLRICHPSRNDMVARITVVPPPPGAWGRPTFLVSFATEKNCDGSPLPLPRAAAEYLRLLSPMERRVALMAVAGSSNRAIAEQLGKSCRTVECQLNAIYRKLNCCNRVRLARLLM